MSKALHRCWVRTCIGCGVRRIGETGSRGLTVTSGTGMARDAGFAEHVSLGQYHLPQAVGTRSCDVARQTHLQMWFRPAVMPENPFQVRPRSSNVVLRKAVADNGRLHADSFFSLSWHLCVFSSSNAGAFSPARFPRRNPLFFPEGTTTNPNPWP